MVSEIAHFISHDVSFPTLTLISNLKRRDQLLKLFLSFVSNLRTLVAEYHARYITHLRFFLRHLTP
jgi:hypothetical protein